MYENSSMEGYKMNLYESDTVASLNHIEVAEAAKRDPKLSLASAFEKEYRENYDDEGKKLDYFQAVVYLLYQYNYYFESSICKKISATRNC